MLVERIGPWSDGMGRIILPTAGGPHAEFASGIASAIARANDATAEVINVVSPGATDQDRTEAMEKIDRIPAILGAVLTEESIIADDDDVDAIAERSNHVDITPLGATREGPFQQLLSGLSPGRQASGRRGR